MARVSSGRTIDMAIRVGFIRSLLVGRPQFQTSRGTAAMRASAPVARVVRTLCEPFASRGRNHLTGLKQPTATCLAAPLAYSRLKCSSFWPARENQGMQLALADHPADLPEGEKRDQCDSKDDSDKKYATRSSAADAGDALANRLPLDYS